MATLNKKLEHQINSLPRVSGVYFFYDKKEIIYIGKAINIKDRVKNHFNPARIGYAKGVAGGAASKDNILSKLTTHIGFIETDSEIDALVLEAQLIKKNLPKFNVVWRDDKNYFYVVIEKNINGLPFVYITHQKDSVNAIYIGPFVEGTALKKTLKYLRRVFPFYTNARHPKNKCTWCHLGLCPGPRLSEARLARPSGEAANLIAEYKKNIRKLTLVLQGKRTRVASSLRKEMSRYARSGVAREGSKEDFKKAAEVRDQLMALERVLQHTHVIEQGNSAVGNWEVAEQKLKEIIGATTSISKIECYDISNIQGKNAVGSMVVFVDGAPAKSQYKKFRIRMENEPNDIAMLKEVIGRRMQHPEWKYPEVMLIDGGIAQLNVAIKTKGKAPIVIISIAKGKQELLIEGKQKISLKNLPQEIYNLVKHLDDEAHRFAISYHRRVHNKSILKS